MIKKTNNKNNTEKPVAKCDQSKEVVVKCDHPEEVITNCDMLCFDIANRDNKTPPSAKNSRYHSCSNS